VSEFGDRRVHYCLRFRRLADVRADGFGRTARSLDLCDHGVGLIAAGSIVDDHRRTFARQFFRNSRADSFRRTSDYGHFTCKLSHGFSLAL
jgi:hypothetical protein